MGEIKKLIKTFVPDYILKLYRDSTRFKPYRGNEVYCPICKSHFNKFGPFGVIERENAKCHKCGSLERHRLLWKYLNEKVDLFNTDSKIKLLHFAPERSFYNIFSKTRNIDYFPCDLSPELYPFNGSVKVLKVDITNIPFNDNYFDVIICNHVLEHISDDKKAMLELYRVMKKNAWGIFQVPIDYGRVLTYENINLSTPAERKKAFGQEDHLRIYGQDYTERLKSVGFKVIEDDYVKRFSKSELSRLGLISSELIYYCEK